MYELTKSQFQLFEDDGSGRFGFGSGRHDQTLFSIHARLLHFDLTFPQEVVSLDGETSGESFYFSDGGTQEPHIWYACKGQVNLQRHIRFNFDEVRKFLIIFGMGNMGSPN